MINRLLFVKVFKYWLRKMHEICNPSTTFQVFKPIRTNVVPFLLIILNIAYGLNGFKIKKRRGRSNVKVLNALRTISYQYIFLSVSSVISKTGVVTSLLTGANISSLWCSCCNLKFSQFIVVSKSNLISEPKRSSDRR